MALYKFHLQQSTGEYSLSLSLPLSAVNVRWEKETFRVESCEENASLVEGGSPFWGGLCVEPPTVKGSEVCIVRGARGGEVFWQGKTGRCHGRTT